ncbi:extracellular solute-binding protein [Microbacterium sp. Au-Mic1]|uniref:extracellular solute-binding protein n=1 Tax=Microbacterium sp. Au-Mic1 TaxID=2906457 RepID=UPI001E3DC96C|nr:extracellular solute-binding protein [Microbacterium sp. Au-Mic1]MCE4026246.1 extracellular solute-binding protein [Microbacterium sp. Au-Mic1]
MSKILHESTKVGTLSRRTFLAGMAATASGLALSSCAAGSTVSNGSSTSLSMLMLGPSHETLTYLTKSLAPAFAKSSGVKLEIQSTDWGSGFQKVTTAAASGTLSDIVMLGGIWTAPLASKNALLPLDDRLKDLSHRSNFIPAMLKDGYYNGHSYALPLYTDTRTPIYRKSFLKAAGVDTDNLPATWEEWAEAAAKLSKANGGPLAFPVDWGIDKSVGLQQTYAQLMFQAGGTYYDSSGKATFASDEGVAALEYMMGFYRRGQASSDMVNSGTGAQPVVNGDAAMTFSGLGAISNAKQFKPEVVEDLIVGLPLAMDAHSDRATTAFVNKIGISARSKNPDAAWKLLSFITDENNSVKLAELYAGLPARSDETDAPYLKGLSPNLTAAARYVVPQPPNANMLAIAPLINTSLQQAVRLQGTAKSILTELDRQIDELNGV